MEIFFSFFWLFWFLWFFLVFLVSLVFLVPVLCSSVPLQPSPNKRAQAPADSIEFPMGSKETLARNWSFHFSQVNYISLFIFVVDRDLSKNSCLTHATTVLSEKCMPPGVGRVFDLLGREKNEQTRAEGKVLRLI